MAQVSIPMGEFSMPWTSKEELLEVRDVLRSPQEDGMYELPDHFKVGYRDIFYDPDMYTSKGLGKQVSAGIAKVFGATFDYVQSGIYYILVMLTGLFLTVLYGILYGFCMYTVVWFAHPFYKLFSIMIRLGSALLRPMTRVALDPFFQSVGQCFTSYKAAIAIHLKGISVNVDQERFQSPAKIQHM